jgi:hypothetical protein
VISGPENRSVSPFGQLGLVMVVAQALACDFLAYAHRNHRLTTVPFRIAVRLVFGGELCFFGGHSQR